MNGPSEFHTIGSLLDWNITDRLPGIDVPTLLISGEFDEATPHIVEQIHTRIPGARWELVAGTSHLTHVEEPEIWLTLVGAFLDEVDARQPAGDRIPRHARAGSPTCTHPASSQEHARPPGVRLTVRPRSSMKRHRFGLVAALATASIAWAASPPRASRPPRSIWRAMTEAPSSSPIRALPGRWIHRSTTRSRAGRSSRPRRTASSTSRRPRAPRPTRSSPISRSRFPSRRTAARPGCSRCARASSSPTARSSSRPTCSRRCSASSRCTARRLRASTARSSAPRPASRRRPPARSRAASSRTTRRAR